VSTSDRHVDFIKKSWGTMREELIERLPGDSPLAGKEGDYASYSEPHTMEECPFTALATVEVKPSGTEVPKP
jgi:hypothetical protein